MAAHSSAPAPARFCWPATYTARRKRRSALMDISVLRNGYGRQLASDVHSGPPKLRKEPLEMVFIRAPIIESVGEGVEILAEDAGQPVLVRQGKILASTFHPELTSDTTVHEHFLKMRRAVPEPMSKQPPRATPSDQERWASLRQGDGPIRLRGELCAKPDGRSHRSPLRVGHY